MFPKKNIQIFLNFLQIQLIKVNNLKEKILINS